MKKFRMGSKAGGKKRASSRSYSIVTRALSVTSGRHRDSCSNDYHRTCYTIKASAVFVKFSVIQVDSLISADDNRKKGVYRVCGEPNRFRKRCVRFDMGTRRRLVCPCMQANVGEAVSTAASVIAAQA